MATRKKITIVGAGYVGYSTALMLANNYDVVIFDADKVKVDLISNGMSPLNDNSFDEYILLNKIKMRATNNVDDAYVDSEYVFVCVPTPYDEKVKGINVEIVDSVINSVFEKNSKAIVVIKSTMPINYFSKDNNKRDFDRIVYCPEFLRERSALQDMLNPSRIVIGHNNSNIDIAKGVESLLMNCVMRHDTPILYATLKEAAAIKLFANSYLAMRISFYNELDSFAMKNNLNTSVLISGIGLDNRIGLNYNNPSFGYGGSCLPKDSKQLLLEFNDVPNDIIKAVVISNEKRKEYIVQDIINKAKSIDYSNEPCIGIYRLNIKQKDEVYKDTTMLDIIRLLKECEIKTIVYEPILNNTNYFDGHIVVNDIDEFIEKSTLIVTSIIDKPIENVIDKVYTRAIIK